VAAFQKRAAVGLTTAFLLTHAPFAAAQNHAESDVQMFRGGPAHTGEYPPTGPHLGGLAWRAPTQGDVVSSPVVAGHLAYVGSGDHSLYAIDLGTGQARWRDSLGAAVTGSPAVANNRVYVTTRTNDLIAVDARTGARVWRFAGSAAVRMPWGHESGDFVVSSPAVVGGRVVFGSRDGHVYAVDAATGRRLWAASAAGQVWSSPAVDRGRVYVGSADGCLYALSLASGRLLWKFATSGAAFESSRFGFDRRTVVSSPAVSGGTVFVGARDGFLYAISADSGVLRWRVDHNTSWVVTSPAVAGGVVYVGSSDARFVQALDEATGRELWRTPIGGIVWSSPAISGRTVYVGDGVGRLHALDARTGTERWFFRTGESVHSSPVVAGDLVIFGSADGGVYALRTTSAVARTRAVFFDSTLRKAASTDDPDLIARFFKNRGYAVVDSRGLDSVYRDSSLRGSVIVFATDVVSDSSAFRRFLRTGGTVVWPGLPPGIWPRDPTTGRRAGYAGIEWDAPRHLIDVDHTASSFDEHAARPSALGAALALNPFRAAWDVDPAEVTDVLALDDWGLAASWTKRYSAGGGRFTRVPGDNLLAMYLIAELEPHATKH
jgi:outer membrane protein assembly factor BamB